MIFTHASLEDKSMLRVLYRGPHGSMCHIHKLFFFLQQTFIDLLYVPGAGGSEISKKQPLLFWDVQS